MRIGRAILIVGLLGGCLAVPRAQTLEPTRPSPDSYPPPLPRRKGPVPPAFDLRVEASIPLKGPVQNRPLLLDDGAVVVATAHGASRVPLKAEGGAPHPDDSGGPAGVPPPFSTWVRSADGKARYRTLPDGRIECQKRTSIRRERWRRSWSLRVGAATPSPPILVGPRVVFGSADNQIYALKRSNGHRLWAADLQDRILAPLSRMTLGYEGSSRPGGKRRRWTQEVILAVPASGEFLVTLDAYDGSRLTAIPAPGTEVRWIGSPLVLEDGRIVVASQGFVPDDAAVVLLRVRAREGRTEGAKSDQLSLE